MYRKPWGRGRHGAEYEYGEDDGLQAGSEEDEEDEEGGEDEEDQDTPQEGSDPRSTAFGVALKALLPRLLPHSHTQWRPQLQRERRHSPRYAHVRCPVFECFECCLVDMVAGMRQMAAALTAAGWAADRLPPGPVRDVLTRPIAAAAAGEPAGAAAAGSAEGGGSGDGGGGREYVEWTDLPRYAQRAIREKARWCWFAGGEYPGAYASVAAHLRHQHTPADGEPLVERLLQVPGGSEQEAFQGRPRFMFGTSYTLEPLVTPDDPLVVSFAGELEELVAANWPWTAARRWGDGAVPFGPNNDVELPCPVPGCDKSAVIDMSRAYDSFKVGLRSCCKADDVPFGRLRDCMLSEQARFGRTCYRGWANLPRYAQLGFIRAARWRWFDEEWHTSDPYHGLRMHFKLEHRGDEEAVRLQALLLDRRGEEAEDTRDNPRRAAMREMEAFIQQMFQKRRGGDGGDGGAADSLGGPAPFRFRR